MFNAFRTWRKASKQTLQQIADKMDIKAPATINRLERVEGVPTLKKSVALFVFNMTDGAVTANDLVGITPEMIEQKKKNRKKRK